MAVGCDRMVSSYQGTRGLLYRNCGNAEVNRSGEEGGWAASPLRSQLSSETSPKARI